MRTFTTALGPFDGYDTGTIARAFDAGQWWDAHLKPILDEAQGQGWALDLGAHIGWFSVYLAQRGHPVVALEPHPVTYGLLAQNLLRHPTALVQAWPLAAYSHTSILQFAPGNDRTDAGAWGYIPAEDRQTYPAGTISVPAVRLDDYLHFADPVTVIKCDCQGADLRALMGLRRTIERDRPLIVFEWEETMAGWQGDVWADYERFFAAFDYRVERITPSFWDYAARPTRCRD